MRFELPYHFASGLVLLRESKKSNGKYLAVEKIYMYEEMRIHSKNMSQKTEIKKPGLEIV